MMGTLQVRVHHNYNASGNEAFGGARKWPVISVHISLQENQETIADTIAQRVMEFIDGLIVEGLIVEGE
jgi:hypothetical protein